MAPEGTKLTLWFWKGKGAMLGRGRKWRGVGALARSVRACSPDATLEVVAGVVFESPHRVAPVVEDGTLVGLVWEEDLPGPWGDKNLRARELMRPPEVILPPDMSPSEAEEVLATRDLRVAPVVDEAGRLLGLVGRAELAAVRTRALKPRRVGGMATPLGVYLTTGQVRAGAPDLGLFLTGVVLGMMQFMAIVACLGLFYLLDKATGLPLFVAALSPSYAVAMGMSWVTKALPGMEILLFLLLLRLSPLAGLHGAEHQVVHAIERGEPLIPERVAAMPRAHRRCGTNLVALFVIAFILAPLVRPWLAILVAVILWRFLGEPIQRIFTTKRPTKRQLMSAIKAGRELLESHMLAVGERITPLARVWNTGLVQVFSGFAAVMGGAWALRATDLLLLVP